MQFKVITLDGGRPGQIEVNRADLAGGGVEVGWQLATARLNDAGFDVVDWRTDEDGDHVLVVAD